MHADGAITLPPRLGNPTSLRRERLELAAQGVHGVDRVILVPRHAADVVDGLPGRLERVDDIGGQLDDLRLVGQGHQRVGVAGVVVLVVLRSLPAHRVLLARVELVVGRGQRGRVAALAGESRLLGLGVRVGVRQNLGDTGTVVVDHSVAVGTVDDGTGHDRALHLVLVGEALEGLEELDDEGEPDRVGLAERLHRRQLGVDAGRRAQAERPATVAGGVLQILDLLGELRLVLLELVGQRGLLLQLRVDGDTVEQLRGLAALDERPVLADVLDGDGTGPVGQHLHQVVEDLDGLRGRESGGDLAADTLADPLARPRHRGDFLVGDVAVCLAEGAVSSGTRDCGHDVLTFLPVVGGRVVELQGRHHSSKCR
jgi:hypothetical protein